MKKPLLLKNIFFSLSLLSLHFSYAQLADGFDIKKAYQQAADKGIIKTDIDGYVNYLHNDYLSHKNGHNHTSRQDLGVYDMGIIRLGGNNSNANKPSSPNSPQNIYCPNAGFEQGTFANWSGSYGAVATGATGAGFPTYNQTSATIVNPAGNNANLTNTANYHTIMTTPATNSVYPNCVGWDSIACKVVGSQTVSEIPVVNPNGGPASVRLNGAISNYRASKLTYNMALNPNNKNFSVSYALVLYNGGHLSNEQPYFSVKITDQNGSLVPGCSVYTVTCDPALTNSASPLYDPSWTDAVIGSGIMYRKWSSYAFDFSNYPAITSVNVEFYVGGCSQGGHWGYAYVDAECSQGGAVASFCSGSNTTILNAPGGYATYQWTGPSGPVSAAVGGNTGSATITPVTAGQVFTCNVTTSNGCSSIFQTTVSITTVSITGVGSTPSCPNGSSGSANVTATGSSSGYTYQWLNSSSAIVSTSQTATGLTPGTYSVIVNSAGCGSATTTVTVGNSPPFFYSSPAPFCGTVAWITQTASGSNYKWYTSAGAIIAGATTQTLTVNIPINGATYFLAFTTASGCRDSIKYTLSQTTGGSIYVSNIKSICAGNTNSYAVINLQTAASPVYSYSVTGPSGYSSILNNTSSLKDSVINLSIGTYSASVFDGQCLYKTTFTVSPYVYSYTLTPPTPTICVPGSTTLTVNFGNTTPTACGLSTTGGCTSPNLIQIGNGVSVNSTTGYPAIYGNFYKNTRHQILYTASELLAAGILPGKISSIAFNISTINGTTTYPNFTIKMKCTSVTNLTSTAFDNTGLTQVYFAPSTNITAGWNTYAFATAYEWDGVSNILIDVCNGLTSSYTNNSSSPYTVTSFVSVRHYKSDGTVACMTTNAATTSNNRPNIKFGNCGGSNPAAFTYSWTPTIGLSSSTSYTTIASPTVTTVYTVEVNPIGQTNCIQARSSTVTVNNPATPTITAVPSLCSNASSLTLSALPTGGTWSLTAATSTLGVFTPSLAAIGNNTITYTFGGTGCSKTTTATITVEKFVPSTITGTINPLCILNAPINLSTALTTSTLGVGVWSGNGVSGTMFDPAIAGGGIHTLTHSTNSNPTASLCPSSSTIDVQVNSVSQPTISSTGPFCTNASTIIISATPAGGVWLGSGVSSSGILTPSLATVGNNTYTYTIGSASCSAVSTTTIGIEQYVPSTITGTINPICLPSPPLNLGTALTTSSLGVGIWSGNGVTGTAFDPNIAGAGTHTLTYSTNSSPTATLCPSFDIIEVNLNSVAQPTILSVGPFCTNASIIVLSATPTGGVWMGSGVSSSGLLNPAMATVGNNTYTYTVGSASCSAANTTTISVEQYVPSTITGTINVLCITNPAINLATALTTSTLGVGIWSGNGVSGTAFDPSTAGSGVHTLTYTTNSSPTTTLCPSFSTIAVSVNSVVQPTITPAGPYCDNYTAQQLTANPSGGIWSQASGVTGVSASGLFTPSPLLVGSNKLYYTLTNAPCVKKDSIVIDVIHFVPATITGALGPYCIYDPAVNLQSIAQFAGGVWSGSGVTTTSFTPSMAGAGTHPITYSTNPSPLLYCGSTETISILVNPKPEVNAIPSNLGGCNYPWHVDFSTSSVPTGIATWNFGDGTPDGNGLMVSHIYSTPGTYIATITYTDNAGCKDTTQAVNSVTIFPVPDAAFEPSLDVTTLIDAEIVFTNQTSDLPNNVYAWDFGGLGGSTDVSPTYLFTNSGEYFITLVAVSPDGCQDTAVKKITINPDVILYVPNAFTPGNNDGLNDVFQIFIPPTGVDFSTFSLSIYDRWGELIYHTNDVNESWTGAKHNSGSILKQDIFVWKINFMDDKKKFYEKMGHVSLMHK